MRRAKANGGQCPFCTTAADRYHYVGIYNVKFACPICGGSARHDTGSSSHDDSAYDANYFCQDCGYETLVTLPMLMRQHQYTRLPPGLIPKSRQRFRPFIRWATIADPRVHGHDTRLPWWPRPYIWFKTSEGYFEVQPRIRRRKLVWKRLQPNTRDPELMRTDGGYVTAIYPTYRIARDVTRNQHSYHAHARTLTRPQMKLLTTPAE
jgi:hypothetical protein